MQHDTKYPIIKGFPNLSLILVRRNGMLLEYIQEQTEEICIEAIKNNPYSIVFVKNLTIDLLKLAVNIKPTCICKLTSLSPEFYKVAVETKPYSIMYIKNKTPELCLLAVKMQPHSIQWMKDKQTEKLCLEAVKIDGLAIKHCKIQNDAICKAALDSKPTAIREIKKPSEGIYLYLISKGGEYFSKIPSAAYTYNIVFTQLRLYPNARASDKIYAGAVTYINNPKSKIKMAQFFASINMDIATLQHIIFNRGI